MDGSACLGNLSWRLAGWAGLYSVGVLEKVMLMAMILHEFFSVISGYFTRNIA